MSMAFENVDYTSLDIPAAPFSDPARIPDFPKNKVPRHIGVIMDGNGRWAKQRGMVRTNGHQAAELHRQVFDLENGIAVHSRLEGHQPCPSLVKLPEIALRSCRKAVG